MAKTDMSIGRVLSAVFYRLQIAIQSDEQSIIGKSTFFLNGSKFWFLYLQS